MAGGSPTKIDVREARRLYESGLSCRAIAEVYGASFSRVASRLRRSGVLMRPGGRTSPTPHPAIDLNELVRLRETGLTFPELAATYGVSADLIRDRYLRATGQQRRESPKPTASGRESRENQVTHDR